jgi:hypothetical protein
MYAVKAHGASCVIVLVACLSGCGGGTQPVQPSSGKSAAATPKPASEERDPAKWSMEHLEDELANVRREKLALEEGTGIFQITGDIKDRDADSITVWGTAYAADSDYSQLGALLNKSNILVLTKKTNGIGGGMYLGFHRFKEKRAGKNGFGATVPVWVYEGDGCDPDSRGAKIARLEERDEELRLIWVARRKETKGGK